MQVLLYIVDQTGIFSFRKAFARVGGKSFLQQQSSMVWKTLGTVKPVKKRPLSKTPKIGFQD